MRGKIRGRGPMMTANQAREEIRSPLDFLVKHHVARGASRMRAYERVADQIGRTPAWVQRVLGRRPDASVGLHDALNIGAAYRRLCDRIAAGTDAILTSNDSLRREIDAALGGDHPVLADALRTESAEATPARGPGRTTASALAAPVPRARRGLAAAPSDLNDLPLWRALTEE